MDRPALTRISRRLVIALEHGSADATVRRLIRQLASLTDMTPDATPARSVDQIAEAITTLIGRYTAEKAELDDLGITSGDAFFDTAGRASFGGDALRELAAELGVPLD